MATRVTGDLYESITGQLFEVGRQLRQQNGYPFDPVMLQAHLQDAIEGRFAIPPYASYLVQANYDLSVEAAIRAGKYDYAARSITSANFPSTRQGTADLDIILVHYNRDMPNEEIDKDLDGRQGLRDVELPELLALGAKYPHLQRQFPIVARGSVWFDPTNRNRNVPCLYRNDDGRSLFLCWLDSRWHPSCRFATVRK